MSLYIRYPNNAGGGGTVTAVTASSPLASSGGTTPNITIQNADATHTGALTSTDWNTFNNKVSSTRAINTSAPLQGGGNLSADRTLSITQSTTSTDGYLSSVDWNTFNGKQAAGNYITALTGDIAATGPGSVAATLATVNGNVGSFGSSTAIPSFTVNAKGLITAASTNVVIAPAGTLTGTTLASNVVNSSLTSLGSSAAIIALTGGVTQTVRSINSNLTVDTTTTDYIILADVSGGALTITLPAPTSGRILIIKDSTGSAHTNNITLAQHASEKIEGVAASQIFSTAWGSWTLTSNGTDWFII